MRKVNYDKEMERIINGFKGEKPKLLLHSCCAPCSTACIERIKDFFDLTVYYYNPNIDDEIEYAKRRDEQLEYCKKLGIQCLTEEFRQEDFTSAVVGHEGDYEGGARCFICYRVRLKQTGIVAKEKGFDYFSTTLTVSPLKNATALNEIGLELEKEIEVKYLPTDFKKGGGYLRSVELSKQNDMYRQNYCGCIFSKNKTPKIDVE